MYYLRRTIDARARANRGGRSGHGNGEQKNQKGKTANRTKVVRAYYYLWPAEKLYHFRAVAICGHSVIMTTAR